MNNQWHAFHAYMPANPVCRHCDNDDCRGECVMNGRMTPTRLELLRIKQASRHAADERTVLRGMLFVGLALVVVASIAMVMR